MHARLTLRKARRLCLARHLEPLFAGGLPAVIAFPLRAVWHSVEPADGAPYKMMISVPKRRLRHAVERNRAKRQVREAFRLNQQLLPCVKDRQLHIGLVWISDTPQPTQKVTKAVQRILSQVQQQGV